MDVFLKVTAGILIASILSLVLTKQRSDLSLLLTIAVCCMVVASAFSYFSPVVDFARRLVELGNLNHELLTLLLKVIGIGMLSQIVGLICLDSGNQSLGKALQIMTTAIILCLSVPVLEEMISLVETILGEL